MYHFSSGDLSLADRAQADSIDLGEISGFSVRAYPNINSVAAQWNGLAARSNGSPFQSIGFARAYLQARSRAGKAAGNRTPLFVACTFGGKLVAIYPFEIKSTLAGRSLVWLADTLCDYNGPIIDRGVTMPGDMMEAIIRRIHERAGGLDYVFLLRNPEKHPIVRGTEMVGLNHIGAEHSAHALALQCDWKDFYKKLRSKDTRRRFRGKHAALAKTGKLVFCRVRGAQRRQSHATKVMDWKAGQLCEAGDRNPFGSEAEPSALRSTILHALQERDSKIDLFCLVLDGEPVAGILAFIADGTFSLWVTAYNPEFSNKYSVGTLLLIKVLELAARSGLTHFDFLMGDEAYKNDWCDIRIALNHIYMPLTLRGAIACRLIEARIVFKKLLLTKPNAMGAIRSLRKLLSRMRLSKGAFSMRDISA